MANIATDGGRVAELGRVARDWGRRKVDELTLDPAGLSTGHRRMVTVGYILTVCLLLAVLASALVPGPQVAFVGEDGPHVVGIPVVVLFSATFVFGWALILTGASDAGDAFPAIAFLCVFEVIGLFASGTGHFVATGVIGLVISVLFLTTESSDRWRAHPLAELSLWLAVLAAAMALGFLTAPQPSSPIGPEYAAARLIVAASLPIWIWLGYDAIRAAIDLGRSGASIAGRRAGGHMYRWLVAAAAIASPLIVASLGAAFGWMSEALNGWLALCFFASLPLAAWCGRGVLRRRWSADQATIGIALIVSLAAVSFAGAMATNIGLVEAISSSLPLPALFLFVILAAYDVIVVGGREAEREGQVVPRSGRVLIYFGAVLLIVGSLALMYSTTSVDPSRSPALVIAGAFLVGWLIGIPGYMQAVRNQRERLVAPRQESVA